jgi:hypothetical protein
LEPLPKTSDDPFAVLVEAGTPRTAHLALRDIFKNLAGDLRVCDPYYGMGSLLRLDLLTHCASIKFLTRQPGSGEPPTLQKAFQDWKRQYPIVESRRHNGSDLHDRYVLSDDQLILIGHGLKDVGNRESFIIGLDKTLAGDLLEGARASFDTRWANAAAFV